MERRHRWLLALCCGAIAVGLFAPAPLAAQPERYDLGLRLRAFERAWDAQPDAAKRQAVVSPLKTAMNAFFSLRLDQAAEGMDRARLMLQGADLERTDLLWANSLAVQPESRLIDAESSSVLVVLRPMYGKWPIPANVRFAVMVGDAPEVEYPLDRFPCIVKVDLQGASKEKNVDLLLKTEIRVGRTIRVPCEQILSRVENRDGRIRLLQAAVAQLPKPRTQIEESTLKHLTEVLALLADRNVMETDYPAARLMAEAETLAKNLATKQQTYTPQRDGQFWLTIPTADGPGVGRIFIPKGLKPGKTVPMVVALHGAGGSENMFFDGYGDGYIVKQCEERGWICLAPRGPGLVGTAPLAGMLDQLVERYPVDRSKILLVGHSMGAAQSIAFAQRLPDRFAMVAALGGGGSIRKDSAAAIAQLPFFIGVGTDDFALNSSRSLRKQLQQANVKSVEFKEYPKIEHIVIVREALPDVLAAFQKLIQPK